MYTPLSLYIYIYIRHDNRASPLCSSASRQLPRVNGGSELDGGVRDVQLVGGLLGSGGLDVAASVEEAVACVRGSNRGGAGRREQVPHRSVVSPVRHVKLSLLWYHARGCASQPHDHTPSVRPAGKSAEQRRVDNMCGRCGKPWQQTLLQLLSGELALGGVRRM